MSPHKPPEHVNCRCVIGRAATCPFCQTDHPVFGTFLGFAFRVCIRAPRDFWQMTDEGLYVGQNPNHSLVLP